MISTQLPKDQVVIFDTTCRDGEQSPGATMTLQEKVKVAEQLDTMGVNVIEAGFPVASQGDFDAVAAIAAVVKRATVCGFTRARVEDVDRTAHALQGAERRRINVCLATSQIHMEKRLKMSQQEVIERIIACVARARKYTGDVEYIAEDATRSDSDFLCRCIEEAIKAGATTIAIPDTVGYTVPEEYFALIKRIREGVPNADKVILAAHCHDDLGMAVANSLAGLRAGIRQIECTINGIGERAGNASLEELVMAIKVRNDVLPYWTSIDTTMLTRASKLVSAVTSLAVSHNKAIVGKNTFAHEAGIHQHGVLAAAETYEIMRPVDVGAKETSLVLGKHSGRHALEHRLKELGYNLGPNQLQEVFARFKALADTKKNIYDEDIEAIIDEMMGVVDNLKLVFLNATAGTEEVKRAIIVLNVEGRQEFGQAHGDGPVTASINALNIAIPNTATLDDYEPRVISVGTDAQVEVRLRLSEDGKTASGKCTDPDLVVASTKAYLRALSKLRNGKAQH